MSDADRRDDGRLLAALVLLTFATGLVDAASVLGLGHVFTANMTGNVVFLGFSLAGSGRVATLDCLVALGAFLIGALGGGRLATVGVPFRAALLASAMGTQNASVRKLGVSDMTTTVLTLTLTGLAAESTLAGGDSPRAARRLVSVALMLFGGLAGSLLLRQGTAWTISTAALLAACACIIS